MPNSLAENVAQAISDFDSIKQAVEAKGVAVGNTPTSGYATLIESISRPGIHPIYGVKGLYRSSPALDRTDDAVGKSFTINNSTGAVSSDFDALFPWNEAEIINDTAGKMLKLPDMYFRVGTDQNMRLTDVAVSKAPSGYGRWYKVDSFAVGCYKGFVENNRLTSQSGKTLSTGTLSQFRTWASANGNGYFDYDLYHRTALIFLWWIEFATKKSDDIMRGVISGSGTMGGNTLKQTGGTNSLATPSGFELTRKQMRWHYIEDFIGNTYDLVDGVYFNRDGYPCYVTADPSQFSDSLNETGTALPYSTPASGWIKAIGWDESNPFLCMPIETSSEASGTTYFCDNASTGSAAARVMMSGEMYKAASSSYGRGLTSYSQCSAGSSDDDRGSRLLKTFS